MGKILVKYLPYMVILFSIGLNGSLYFLNITSKELGLIHIFFLAPIWYFGMKETFRIENKYRNLIGGISFTFAFVFLQYSLAASETTGYVSLSHLEKLFTTCIIFGILYAIVFYENKLGNFELHFVIYILGTISVFYFQYFIYFKQADTVNSLFLFTDILLLYTTFHFHFLRSKTVI